MLLKTRAFELCNGKYRNLSELAEAMEISVSQIYRVREGRRNINHKFIIGVLKAFPERKFDELFYFVAESLITVEEHRESVLVSRNGQPSVEGQRAWGTW